MALRMLPIARPCGESFDDMPGDARTRHCARCGEHVHDLSAGTEEQARELFRRAGGRRLCVRFARDASGAVRFGLAAAAALSLASCSSAAPAEPATAAEQVDYDMGDGIPDQVDRCPDTPSGEDDGCPLPDAGRD